MTKCCGPKAFTKKIKVGDEEIPVKGLEPVMFLVFNMNMNDEEKILYKLRSEITKLGNIIPATKEKEFNNALVEEYRAFADKRISLRKNKRGLHCQVHVVPDQ